VWVVVSGALLLAGIAGVGVFVPLALVLLVIATGLVGWHMLMKPANLPIVVVTEFAAATPTGVEAVYHHRDAIVERLTNGPLGDYLEVRGVPVAVNRDQAKRLLDAVPASAVVFGSAKAIADQGTWEAELLVRWPGDDTAPSHVTPDLVVEDFDRRTQAPDRHEIMLEPQAPLERLIAERFESHHADRIEGTLLALAAVQGEGAEASAALGAAERYRAQVSSRTRAELEVVRARTEHFESGPAVLQALEEAGLRDADEVALWTFAVGLSFYGLLVGEVSIERHASFAERAVAADPSNPTARYNRGEAYMALRRPEEALAEFDLAAAHPEYRDRYYVHFARGMITYNLGRPAEARDAYRRAVGLCPSARGFLYLADAYRQMGEEGEARVNYRRALKLQPTLVDAHRGYWYIDEPPGKLSLWFDPMYLALARLSPRRARHRVLYRLITFHYRRHPEDSRVHFMLGAHALLLGRLDEAEERLQFAYDLLDGVDIEALARLIIVWALQGRLDDARDGLVRLRETPSPENGDAPTEEELRVRAGDLLSPFIAQPGLTHLAGAEDLRVEILETFPEVFAEADAAATSPAAS